MLRKFVVILTLLLCSMATQVYALGLGAVSVESSLNQPLRVRIELLQLGDTRLQDVNVQMASTDDFQRFNIDRVGFLSNVRFSLQAMATGNAVILTSNQIVREPYLSFILETRWPSGRLLSEHTILLDLPVFDEQQATPAVRQPISPILRQPSTEPPIPQTTAEPAAPSVVSPATSNGRQTNSAADLQPEQIGLAPTAATEPAPQRTEPDEVAVVEAVPTALAEAVVEEEPLPVAAEIAAEAEPQVEEAPEQALAQEEEPQAEVAIEEESVEEIAAVVEAVPEPEAQTAQAIETSSTDTLSAIALQVRPDSSVTLQQTMLAIQQLNPDAFADGNINRLQSGRVLRIPTLAEIQAIDAREAVDEVARQSQQIAQAADIQPLAAPADTSPVQDDAQQGRLSVVDSDAELIDGLAGAGLDAAEIAQLDERIVELESLLAVSQDEADRARIEREELERRLQNLESQIAAAEEIIRLQDIQLAQLQDSLAAAAAIAQQQAALAAETAQARDASSSLVDDLIRSLGANNIVMLIVVALIILLLVVLLLRRNRAAKHDDEEIDEIAEQAFDVSDDSNLDAEHLEPESEFEDFDAADLDDELSGIIDAGDDLADQQKTQAVEGDDLDLPSDNSDAATMDVLSRATRFAEVNQFDSAVSLLNTFLGQQQDNPAIRQKLDEVLATQAEYLAKEQRAAEEAKSFLDHLGIDIDAFDDDEVFGSTADQAATVEDESTKAESELLEDQEQDIDEDIDEDIDDIEVIEILEPDEIDVTEDWATDKPALAVEEVSKDVAEDSGDNAEEIESVAYSLDDFTDDSAADTANDLKDLEIDTLEFDIDPTPEIAADPQAETEQKLDLETFSFLAEGDDAAPDASADEESESEVESAGIDFDFDEEDIEEETSSAELAENEKELETFDFDLDEDSTKTVVEVPDTAAESIELEDDDFDLDEFDLEVAMPEGDSASVNEELPVNVTDTDTDDDLEFLSDDFELKLDTDDEIEEIELLPDYDESESATKLELAYAYQKMGDPEGAKEILREVIREGNDEQITEAKALLNSIAAAAE
jgi:pilus assembly protein FimV